MNKRRAIKIASCIVATIVAAVVLLPAVTVSTRAIDTCTLCRAEHSYRTVLGYSWESFRDTGFTSWYHAHRPPHQHEWGRLTCTRGSSIVGTATFFQCGPRHPVCDIPPELLRKFAENADTNTLTAFFDGIISTNLETQKQAVKMAWDNMP